MINLARLVKLLVTELAIVPRLGFVGVLSALSSSCRRNDDVQNVHLRFDDACGDSGRYRDSVLRKHCI